MADKKTILDALKPVAHALARTVDALVSQLILEGDKVGLVLDFQNRPPQNPEDVRADVEEIVRALDGVGDVSVVMTASKHATPPPELKPAAKAEMPPPAAIPGVKNIIAVGSGKGGVGKSTTAVNLAIALSESGLKVGLLDADIFGPSLPKLLGIEGEKPQTADGKILPTEVMGLRVMSIGLMLASDDPIIWRGPQVMRATGQLLSDVAWGELDVLVIDLPPGTGDVQLTLVQKVPLTGAVIVSTPQDLALIDARKGLQMFRKVGTPVLGIVENMSYFLCPKCGEQADIFGHGGARETAKELGTDFLGEVPLHMSIRAGSDAGNPVVRAAPLSQHAAIYSDIAAKIASKLAV